MKPNGPNRKNTRARPPPKARAPSVPTALKSGLPAEPPILPAKIPAGYTARRCRAERNAQDNKAQAKSEDQTQSPPIERPKDSPSAKIISIETVERPPAPPISVPEPPPSALPAVDPALPTDK